MPIPPCCCVGQTAVVYSRVMLATVGVLITTVITGCFIHEMMRLFLPQYAFGWAESLLLASIMSSTDSASVFSILNSSGIGLKQRLKPMLELESGSNDPMEIKIADPDVVNKSFEDFWNQLPKIGLHCQRNGNVIILKRVQK